MPFYLRFLIALVPLTLTLVLLRLFHKQGGGSVEKSVLKMPRFYRIVCLVVVGVAVICSVCVLLFQFEEWPVIIIFLGFMGLPFLVIFIMWSLWRVDIQDEGFIYRNFWGRKKAYKYEDLEYEMHPRGLKWFFYKDGKKVFCMAYYIEGGDFLEKKYRKYMQKKRKAHTA